MKNSKVVERDMSPLYFRFCVFYLRSSAKSADTPAVRLRS